MRVSNCRSCNSAKLLPVLDLGKTPLANSLLSESQLDKPEPRFQLEVVFCPECSLVQLIELVAPEDLFTEYAYFSSFSDTMLAHSRVIATELTKRLSLGPTSLAMEVASNDGYLLQYYKELGVPVLGIEPARNVAKVAVEKGIDTRCEFFGKDSAEKLASDGKLADVIHANNVLAHVPDLNGVVSGFATALKPDGVVVVEAPYVRDMIENVEFDTIYHEHICYFSLTALQNVFSRNGLTIVDVERLPIHGGSLRIFAKKHGEPGPRVVQILEEERQAQLDQYAAYKNFADRTRKLCEDLRAMLLRLKGENKRIAAYGAAAKGSTLLNSIRIGAETLDFVADRSSVKQGRYMPGVHLKICPPEELVRAQPDYVLLLTWNFAEEIMLQQQEYLTRGGKFIVPVPTPHVVSAAGAAVRA